MAFIDVPPYVLLGDRPFIHTLTDGANDAHSINAATLDASGEKVAFLLRVPRTGTLNGIHFLVAQKTQWPTNGIRFSFQDLAAAAIEPDGTQDQYRVITTEPNLYEWTSTGLMTSDGTDMGTKRSVTAGDYMCIVAEFESWASGDDIDMGAYSHIFPTNPVSRFSVAKGRIFTSSWGDMSSGKIPSFYLDYDDGSIWALPNGTIAVGGGGDNLGVNTTPDEVGVKFSYPIPVRVRGIAYGGSNPPQDHTVHLYDSEGTELASGTLNNNMINTASDANTMYYVEFDSGDEVELTAGATYRATVKMGATTRLFDYCEYDSNAHMMYDAFYQTSQEDASIQGTVRTDGGSWTDSNTKLYHIRPIANAIDPVKSSSIISPGSITQAFAPMFGRFRRGR